MHEPMEATIRHAKFLARYLNRCDYQYIIRIALKEIGVPSGQDGFHYLKSAVAMLLENPYHTLKNGIYLEIGLQREPPAGQEQVEQSIRFGIRTAWRNRNHQMWSYYFPEGCSGNVKCPSNREFIMAIVDFVELWKACCEEACYEAVK